MYRPLAAISWIRSQRRGRHQREPQAAVCAEAPSAGRSSTRRTRRVAPAALPRRWSRRRGAAPPGRRPPGDGRTGIARRWRSRCGSARSVRPRARLRQRVVPGAHRDGRLGQPRGAGGQRRELRRELAEDRCCECSRIRPNVGQLPERAGASVAKGDHVVGGQAEQLGQPAADPLDEPPAPATACATCRGRRRPAARAATCSARIFVGPLPNRPSFGLRSAGNDEVAHCRSLTAAARLAGNARLLQDFRGPNAERSRTSRRRGRR